MLSPKKPCAECPWRRDVAPGQFPPERFRALARTAENMSPVIFQCHKSGDLEPLVCAGFMLRGSAHNFAIRMAWSRGELTEVEDGGYPLVRDYVELATRNGVSRADPALGNVRTDTAP